VAVVLEQNPTRTLASNYSMLAHPTYEAAYSFIQELMERLLSSAEGHWQLSAGALPRGAVTTMGPSVSTRIGSLVPSVSSACPMPRTFVGVQIPI